MAPSASLLRKGCPFYLLVSCGCAPIIPLLNQGGVPPKGGRYARQNQRRRRGASTRRWRVEGWIARFARFSNVKRWRGAIQLECLHGDGWHLSFSWLEYWGPGGAYCAGAGAIGGAQGARREAVGAVRN